MIPHINPNVYYKLPEIYLKYYDHQEDWIGYINGLDIGIQARSNAAFKYYFRIVDAKKFMMTYMQLGLDIDDQTPGVYDAH
jgi:hypothetical protein